MKPAILAAALSAVVPGFGLAGSDADGTAPVSVRALAFVGMPAPDTPEERAAAYTKAKARVIDTGGAARELELRYHLLHDVIARFGSTTVGDRYDATSKVLLDANGRPKRSETPDASILLQVPGAARGDATKNRLVLVTDHEYDWLDTAGNEQYGKQVMTMSLATIDQDKVTGALTTVGVKNIDSTLKAALEPMIDKYEGGIGYLTGCRG
jgi:hypothetical protein